jgi:hypothetical protein
VVVGLFLAGSAEAFKFKGSVGIRSGYVNYVGGEDYWNRLKSNFRQTHKDFATLSYGVEVTYPVTSFLDFVVGVDWIRSRQDISSRVIWDVDGDGSYILKNFTNTVTLDLVPIHVLGMRYHPLKKERWFSPFVGLQMSLLMWRYQEEGTFVIPDYHALDDNINHAGSEVPDYLVIHDKPSYLDFDLALNFQVGSEFYPYKRLTIGVYGRYVMADDQLNRQFEYLTRKVRDEQWIQHVMVTTINVYDTIKLNHWEVSVSILYKF